MESGVLWFIKNVEFSVCFDKNIEPMNKKSCSGGDSRKVLLETGARIRVLNAECSFYLDAFSEHLAKTNGWDLSERDPIYLYLVKKYKWTLNEVRSLSDDDLKLVLHEEYRAWTPSADVIKAFQKYVKR